MVPRRFILLLLLPLFVLYGCGKQASNVMKIGAILPITGDQAAWGNEAQDGIMLAIKSFNANRPKIEARLFVQDTRGEPRSALAATHFLISTENVAAIVGDMTSATTLAAAPLCDTDKVVLITPVASSPLISKAGDYVFRIYPSDDYEAEVVARKFINDSCRRVATIYTNDDYGKALEGRFKQDFADMGGVAIAEFGFQPGTSDFRSYIAKLEGYRYDAIYLISFYKDGAQFLRQKFQLGNKKPVIGAAALMQNELIRIAGIAADGLIIPQKIGFSSDNQDSITVRFVSSYRKEFGPAPDFVAAQAYDAANVILSAIKAGATSGESIRQFLHTHDYGEGVTGYIAFDEFGGLKSAKFQFVKVVKGNFVVESD